MTLAKPAPDTTHLAGDAELPVTTRPAGDAELPVTTRPAGDAELPVATRLAGDAELPAVGRWQIDPGHTELAFVGRHFMLTKVRGRFTGLSGVIEVAEEPADTTIEVTIDMASVESGSQARDDHLRSADFFDVIRHPQATFSGHASGWHGARGLLTGDLTIRGITRPVTLQAEYVGYAADPWGGHRAVFSAAGTVDREDWDLTWNLPLDGGGLLVSKEIRIEIELEAVLEPEA